MGISKAEELERLADHKAHLSEQLGAALAMDDHVTAEQIENEISEVNHMIDQLN